MVDTTISHYRILERLGGGGMGVVYKAEDTRLKRIVAIKVLPFDLTRDIEAKERFIHEARAASALQHPNISAVHDLDSTPDGQLFIVQEYHRGKTLSEILASRRFSLAEALDLALQIARGLIEVHRRGIVHRDIKPGNIMVTDDGTAKIVDFGLAKLLNSSTLTKEGTMLGTPAYMSPEQLHGALSSIRTDIWSIGVLLYEMLTGRRPFESEFEEGVIYAILHEDPRPATQQNPELPADIDRVLARALQRDPENRYPDMEALASDLELIERGLRLTGPRSVLRTLVRPGRRRRIAIALTACLVLIAGVYFAGPYVKAWFSGQNRTTIAVASCQDQSGDSLAAECLFAISDALTRYLGALPQLEVVPVGKLYDLAVQIGRVGPRSGEEVPVVTAQLAQEACRVGGFDGMLLPMLSKRPSGDYALSLEIKHPRTGRLIGMAVSHAVPLPDLMAAVRGVIQQISRELGLSPEATDPIIARVASLTTTSFDAYEHFALARHLQPGFRGEAFGQQVSLALEHDSTFGSAYMILADKEGVYLNFRRARDVLERAANLGILEESPQERHWAQMSTLMWTDRYGSAAMEERTALQRAYVELQPKDKDARCRVGTLLREQGLIQEAIDQQEAILKQDSEFTPSLNELAWLYAYHRGDLQTGLEYANTLEALRPGGFASTGTRGCIRFMMGDIEHAFFLHSQCYSVAPSWNAPLMTCYMSVLQEDYQAAERERAIQLASATTPFIRAMGELMGAHLDFWRGRLEAGRRKLRLCLLLADSTDNDGLRAEVEWLSLWSTLREPGGVIPRPTADIWIEASGLTRLCNPWFAYYRGLVDLRAGRLDSLEIYARQVEADAGHMIARDQEFARSLATQLRRERLLAMDSAATVLALPYTPPDFTTLVPHINYLIEPGADGPRMSLLFSFGADIQARAYLAVGDTELVILEYERLIRREPSRKLWIFPKHHFALAQLYEHSGAPERAAQHYRDFLQAWDQADTVFTDTRIARERLEALDRNRQKEPVAREGVQVEGAHRTLAFGGTGSPLP